MNRDEFNRWKSDACLRWPSVAKWLSEVPSAHDTLSLWFSDVLDDVELEDALEANRRLFAGGEIEPWKRELLPATVAKTAREIRAARLAARDDMPVTSHRDDALRKYRPTMRRALQEAIPLPLDQRARKITEVLQSPNDDGEPRYRCLECRDEGVVESYDRETLQQAVDAHYGARDWDSIRPATCCLPCRCEAGDGRKTMRVAGRSWEMPRFDIAKWQRVTAKHDKHQQIEELRGYAERVCTAKVTQLEGGEFHDFTNGASAGGELF